MLYQVNRRKEVIVNITTKLLMGDEKLKYGRYRMFSSPFCPTSAFLSKSSSYCFRSHRIFMFLWK